MKLRHALSSLVLAALACAPGDQTSPVEPEIAITDAVVVGKVTIVPDVDTITSIGGTVQLSTVLRNNAGAILPPGSATVTWASTNPSRAKVSASGKVTSLAGTGQARITARVGAKSDTALILLLPASPRVPSATASTITAAPLSIARGTGTALLSFVIVDAAGVPIPGASVTIAASGGGNSVSLPAITDANGATSAVFSSTTLGAKTITASANGVLLTHSAIITVRNPLEAITPVLTCVIPPSPPAGGVNLATDVTYDSPGGVPLKLDVAWPKTAGIHPFVVIVHGGGWFKGDKSTFRNEILLLAAQEYTVIAVNYRLVSGNTNRFPTAAKDLRCALRWIRARAGQYSLDPDRGAAMGLSSGGHLAELLGLAPNVSALDGPCSVAGPMATIDAVAAFAGPSDLTRSSLFTSLSLPTVSDLLGGVPENVPALAALASPIKHVGAGDPVVLLVHGTADPVIPVSHSSALKTALNQAGVAATFIPLNLTHDIYFFSTTSTSRAASCTALAFLKQELQP